MAAASPAVAPARYPGISAHVRVSETHRRLGSRSVQQWAMGDGSWLMHLRYRALAASVDRSRPTDPETRLITMAVLAPGNWSLSLHGVPVAQQGDQPTLVALDQSTVFDFRGGGTGTVTALHITHSRLMLSIETVHQALGNLSSDLPLYPLARNHLQQIGVIAATAADFLPELSGCSVSLMRSLLISAAEGARRTPNMRLRQIERFIEDHLHDRRLSAEVIAAVHHISARQLYKIWPTSNGSLHEYITTRRLVRSRASLLQRRHLSIAEVASSHGFAHPTHFTRRFRAEFGIAPSQWRQQNSSSRLSSHSAHIDGFGLTATPFALASDGALGSSD